MLDPSAPFEMSVDLALASAGLLFAGIVKGATGLGYASAALPLLVLTVGHGPAMAIVLVPAVATNVSVAVATGHAREIALRFGPLYLAMVPGIAAGVAALRWVDEPTAIAALGLSLISYAALALARPDYCIPLRLHRPLLLPTGFLNGVVTGLTGSQVMPLLPFVLGLRLDSARTVQAMNLAVLVASSVLGIALAFGGLMTPFLLCLSALAVLPALAGVSIGTRIRERLAAETFRTTVLLVLIAMGAGMLVRA
jgi:hypothetical protein